MPCAICGKHTLSPKYRLCSTHWKEYGPLIVAKEAPDWLRFLIAATRRVNYKARKAREWEFSLDYLLYLEEGCISGELEAVNQERLEWILEHEERLEWLIKDPADYWIEGDTE